MTLSANNDYGHGGKDPGAIFGNIQEKVWTLDIGKRVTEGMKKQGIKTSTTRDSDVTLSNDTRVAKVKNSKAKYCFSHHINAGKGTGAEILISQYNDGKLANEILKELAKLGLRNRGAKKRKLANGKDHYFMHRLTGNVTTLIIEYGFIDTKSDRDFLSIASNRQKCADAVVRALCRHEGIKYKEVKEPSTPKPPTSNKGDGYYRVVTGSYQDKKLGEIQMEKLKKAGFDSFLAYYEK